LPFDDGGQTSGTSGANGQLDARILAYYNLAMSAPSNTHKEVGFNLAIALMLTYAVDSKSDPV